MIVHGLCGLPRAGTTLLANVLAQHPDVHASGTSALCKVAEKIVTELGQAEEVQSDLANVPGSYERYLEALRGLCAGWYSHRDEPVIVDKGRGWIMYGPLLAQLYPGAQLVVCVRDPRDVVASVERVHRRTPVFPHPMGDTIDRLAETLMVPNGMVGGPCRFIEDALRRKLPNVIFVRYESLTVDPALWVGRVHDALGLEPHAYDFEGVTNEASDLDALYRGKFPHDAAGAIKPNEARWQDVMSDELAQRIAVSYPLFMQTFGYS